MNRELLERGLNDLEIDFSEEQLDQFAEYSELLKEWNKKINLTAITDDDGIAVKHFLDCAEIRGFQGGRKNCGHRHGGRVPRDANKYFKAGYVSDSCGLLK